MTDRIVIDQEQASVLKLLKEDADREISLFPTYYHAVAFAACLGHYRGAYREVNRVAKEPEPIRREYFANDGLDYLIDLLALAHTGDPKVLSETEEQISRRCSIFAAYANGGLLHLRQRLDKGEDPIEVIQDELAQTKPVSQVGAPSIIRLMQR